MPLTDKEKPAKRPLWTIVLSLVLGAVALWGSSRLTWFAEVREAGVRGMVLYTETGGQRVTALVPLALLALAGIAGVVATSGWPRVVLGVLLVLAGAGGIVTAGTGHGLHGWDTREIDGVALPLTTMLVAYGLAALGGLLVLLAGALTIRVARTAPKLGARYAAPGEKPRVAKDKNAQLWDALSEGDDPTTHR